MSIGNTYIFKNVQERYLVSGKVLDSVKGARKIRKMKHVKRHDIIYTIFDIDDNIICHGNASKNWKQMKDEINNQKVGKVKINCIEITWY